MRKKLVSLGVAAWLSTGCLDLGDGEGDAKVPGEALGTYHVSGRLQEDGCKSPALGASDPWEFDVKLSRFDRDLYWLNGREAIVGDIAADGVSFRFETRLDFDLDEPHGAAPGCTIARADSAAGKLSSDGTDVGSFEAVLSFSYSQERDSDCSAYVGDFAEISAIGFAVLPCTIGYAVGGLRTAMVEKR